MCTKCQHPADDHSSAGTCKPCSRAGGPCASAASSPVEHHRSGYSTVRVCTNAGSKKVWVEMPAATTARYAAKRVAEALGLDPEAKEYLLLDPADSTLIDPGAGMRLLDGRFLLLAWR